MAVITTISATDAVTSSRTVLNANMANLNADKIETSVLDTDTALTANSDTKVATQRAVKAYVDGVGVSTATTLVRGTVEIATQGEVDAGTAIGATGASLVVTPATLKSSTGPIIQVFTASGTWTKPAGLKYVVVEVQAPGGAGGGVPNIGNVGGGGGGAGGYAKRLRLASALGATETVTVGATTSFTVTAGPIITTSGGAVGTAAAAGNVAGGAGGTASGGDVNTAGGRGDGASNVAILGGGGASSPLGTGGALLAVVGDGNAATGYGAGGGGAKSGSSANLAGGAASAGVIIVTEYYV